MSKQSDGMRAALEVKRNALNVLIEAEKYEECAEIKAEIEDLEARIKQIEDAESEVSEEINSGPGEPVTHGGVAQLDPSMLDEAGVEALGIDMSKVAPMMPGFEKFVSAFRHEFKETSNEMINEVGKLSSRIRLLNSKIQNSDYKGNEALYLLAYQEAQHLIPLFNQSIGVIEGGADMIDALGDIGEYSVLNRACCIGSALVHIGMNGADAYKLARDIVSNIDPEQMREGNGG